MLGDLMGDLKGRQKALQKELAATKLSAEAGDGAVRVTVNAVREVLDISIDKEKIDLESMDQLEDFLLIAMNRALSLAAQKEVSEGEKLMKDMLPPGLGDLGDFF